MVPQRAGDEVALARDDLADVAALDALDGLEVGGVVAFLRSGDDGQLLLRGDLGGRDDRPHAHRVDGHGLLAEDVLAGLDGLLHVQRAEPRRLAQQDEVHAARQELLAGVKAAEAAVVGDLDLLAQGLEALAERIDAVLEEVGQCPHDDARRRLDAARQVGHAAPAAAHQADLDRVGTGGVGAGGRSGSQRRGAGEDVLRILHGKPFHRVMRGRPLTLPRRADVRLCISRGRDGRG